VSHPSATAVGRVRPGECYPPITQITQIKKTWAKSKEVFAAASYFALRPASCRSLAA
jgi:hypothetical protein